MLNFPSKPLIEKEFEIIDKESLLKTMELKTSQERIEGSSTATQSCSVSFHCLFEMQGRANLLQTEFNRAFQTGSQTEAFFDIELKTQTH